ncbi:MAG: 4Fe-4S dicluster domain-containing protein [Bacteroidales bacterium]|nr:4Fe-4S dicluster domain-containing protein [Bacteroidales bacterium]
MDTKHYYNFLDTAEEAIDANRRSATFALKAEDSQMPMPDVRELAVLRTTLDRTIENLDAELSRFEQHFAGSHNQLFWARDYNDVFDGIRKIAKKQKAKTARLPKMENSFIFRELGMKFFLRDENISLSDDGDLQFFYVDLMLADAGSLLLLNSGSRAQEKLSNSRTNIFISSIDRVLANSDLVDTYRQLLAYKYGAGSQDFLLFKGSPNCESYLFVVDNQRTALMAAKSQRRVLACLHCGRCNDVCPVLQSIGEEPYNNVFVGPVANIMLPYLESQETDGHVIHACTLCGRCEEVCPIALPIRDMIVDARQTAFVSKTMDKKDRKSLLSLRKLLTSRAKMNKGRRTKGYIMRKHQLKELRHRRKMPQFAKIPFAKMYAGEER